MPTRPRAHVLRDKTDAAVVLLAGPAFLLLGAWFLLGPRLANVPSPPASVILPVDIDTAPRRTPLGDPPVTTINSYQRNCMDCHMLFPSPSGTQQLLRQHEDIVLDHGLNDRCLNCHDNADRDRLVLHDGATIGYGQVELLCAQCHGPTYRQWQRGGHGRTTGYWDAQLGPRRRLGCAECHEPHAPAFDAFVPLPGPNTLRMGDQDYQRGEHERAGADNPLRTRSPRGSDATDQDEHR